MAAADPLGLAALPLTDGAIRMRRPVETDAPSIVTICDDPEVVRFTPSVPTPYGETDALVWLAVQAADAERGTGLHLAVEDVATGAHVATASLFRVDHAAARGEIGYMVHPAWRGRRVATRAVRLLAAHAFGTLGLHRLDLLTLPENTASRLVALRAGFREEGEQRGTAWRGGFRDVVVHGRLADDPPEPGDPLRAAELPSDGVVALRLPRLRDVPAIVEACRDPEIARWTTIPQPYGPEHAEGFVLGAAGLAAAGSDLMTLIVDAATDAPLGSVGLHRVGGGEGMIGYWLAPAARGRGVATRGVRLLVRHALATLDLRRLWAEVLVGNDPSLAVLHRCGFVQEGLARERPHRGGLRDRHQLALIVLPAGAG